jgi:ferric enterobactin receptor
VYYEGNSTTRPENLISEKAWGAEFTAAWTPLSWWKLDMNINFFHADIDGTNILSTYKASTYSWFARQTSRFVIPRALEMQLRANYEAAQKTAQGKRKALYYVDFSASRDIFKGKGTINLNILDVFNSRKFRSISTGPNFYTEGFQFRKRQINLTLNYRIKQAKQLPKKVEPEDGQ